MITIHSMIETAKTEIFYTILRITECDLMNDINVFKVNLWVILRSYRSILVSTQTTSSLW